MTASEDQGAPDPTEPEGNRPTFEAPHPGSQRMPRWTTNELIEPPKFTSRNWFALLGPGLVMGAAAIGGGEWLLGPLVTAKYGGALMWLATLSIVSQGLYNTEISRYTLYCGEPIFTGKFRTLPGPFFWLVVYVFLDFGAIFPYLAANAATPVAVIFLRGEMPNPDVVDSHWWLMKWISVTIFLSATVPLFIGGKVYNSLKIVMTCKLIIVVTFLLFLAVFYSHSSTWLEICSGFVKFGNVPVLRGEDRNGNGVLDEGEDWDGDGHLDVEEEKLPPTIDTDGDNQPDEWPRENGVPVTFVDVDQDGFFDGTNVDNVFTSLWSGRGLPEIDLTWVVLIAGLAAIAGNGGLTNTPISNMTRDQGWGMGYHVGAIPSIVGGRGIALSHVGCVFRLDKQSRARWKGWYRHVLRDQFCVWVPACVVGVALPSMLSVQFLRRGTHAGNWNVAGMTASGVGDAVASPPHDVLASLTGLSAIIGGPAWGNIFWGLTLFCGFMVLAPSMVSSIDGIIRRWVDVVWTASARLRTMDSSFIKQLYFRVLVMYILFGLTMLWLGEPTDLIKIATLGYNFAFGFSCWHTLVINCVLLPRELRPNWIVRLGLILAGSFFTLLGCVASYLTLREFGVF